MGEPYSQRRPALMVRLEFTLQSSVARAGRLAVGESADAARERKMRRTPIRWFLIVAGDAGQTGDIFAIRKERHRFRARTAEAISQPDEKPLAEPVRPVDARHHAEG